jgi:hypothetical protein
VEKSKTVFCPYSLFLGHLSIEKIVRAIYAERTGNNLPFTHRLVYLADKASLKLTIEKLRLLETITDFNLEEGYPDENFLSGKSVQRNLLEGI